MGLETGTYISDLVATNPVSNDPKSQGDDHLRLLKSTIKTTFPGVAGAVTPTHTELNYVDGVTSAIQGQIDLKAPIDSPVFTGTPSVPTAAVGVSGGQAASLDFVIASALSSSLPGQTGNAGKFLTTDGTNGSWGDAIDPSIITLTGGVEIVGESGVQSLSDKTLVAPVIADNGDSTKKLSFNVSGISTATTRTITVVDEDIKLFTGYAQYIGQVSASNSATVDIELFTSEFDDYIIECNNLVQSTGADKQVLMRIKKGGAYTSTGYTYQQIDGDILTAQDYYYMHNVDTGSAQISYFNVRFSRVNDVAAHGWTSEISNSTNLNGNDPFRGGNTNGTSALQGVRFSLSGGNIATGDFKLYGIRKP